MANKKSFPTDPIESGTAKLRYGLNQVVWRQVRRRIRGWRPDGSQTELHSESEILQALEDISAFEPGEIYEASR